METIEVSKEIDKRDEDQIVREMRGELVKSFVYSFVQQGRQVTALSYAGVKEFARRRGNIDWFPCQHCNKPVHVEEDGDVWRTVVRAWDLTNNVKFLGAAEVVKKQPFAWVLAVNKAERNALRKMLPEKELSILIEQWLRSQDSKPPPAGKLQ